MLIINILSNAERLEIIKGTPYLITDDVLLRDFKWLVARVEVLEANLTGSTEVLDEAIASYTKSVNQNARLREALQRACNSLGADMEDYL